MKEKDTTERILLSHGDIFADVADALMFGGRRIITPRSLADAQTASMYKAGGAVHGLERDVAKYWRRGLLRVCLIGMEGQTRPDADMVLRAAGYDGASYRAQLDGKAHAERHPVVTLVLYFGTDEPWTAARSLLERVQVPDLLRPFVSDYRLNVFELAWLSDAEAALFRSDFREVVEYLRCKRRGVPFPGSRRRLDHALEVLELFRLLSGDRGFDDIRPAVMRMVDAGKEVTVDTMFQKMREEARTAGIAEGVFLGRTEGIAVGRTEGIALGRTEGIALGQEQMAALFSRLFKAGRVKDAERATSDRAYLKQLMDEYQK